MAGSFRGLTLGNYQEIRIRHFERAVDRYVGMHITAEDERPRESS